MNSYNADRFVNWVCVTLRRRGSWAAVYEAAAQHKPPFPREWIDLAKPTVERVQRWRMIQSQSHPTSTLRQISDKCDS